MPGVPGFPWLGADRSAEVHQPCLQCCSAEVLQTVAGVQGDDVVSYQTRRHIIYITGADTTPGGHT